VPDKRAPPVGASLSAPSPSLYLSAPWDRAIGAILPPPPSVRSLSVPPPPPVSSSSTSRPQSPRRGRAHDRAFSGHVRVPAPLLSLAPCLPTSPLSFAPSAQPSHPLSLALPTRTGSPATARRRPLPVPWPLSRTCPVQCHGDLRLTVNCSGRPSVRPLPFCFVRSALTGATFAQPELRHRRPVEPLRLRRCFATPALLLEVSNLPAPMIWSLLPWLARDCSPKQSSAAVSPLRHGLRSLVPPRQCEGHG
jgi:hypothetical protein